MSGSKNNISVIVLFFLATADAKPLGFGVKAFDALSLRQILRMLYTATVSVMPLKELLDPQGKAVTGSLHQMGISPVQDVRIGKQISLQIEAPDAATAKSIAEEASKKLLANPVMEYFEVQVQGA